MPLTGLASSELPLPDYNEKATKLISFLKRLIFWNGGSNGGRSRKHDRSLECHCLLHLPVLPLLEV